jgi:hypothetical protein
MSALYQLTNNVNVILNTQTGAFVPVDPGNRDYQAYEVWLAAGNLPDPAPGNPLTETLTLYEGYLTDWINQTVQQNGYADINSCISYLNSSVAQWQQDAQAALAWRDDVWKYAFTWEESLNGSLPGTLPTKAAFLAMFPQPSTYGWTLHLPGAYTAASSGSSGS